MNLRHPLLFAVALLLVSSVATPADEVDDYIRAEMKKQHVPGLSLAVLKEGAVVKAEGYGWAQVEKKIPVTPHTVFQLQSVTKSFTATAIMMLVEEGKVGVDDPIGKHLTGLPESWNGITVRHLLTHTSGIKDFINEPTVDLKKDITAEEVITSLVERPLNFQPGEKYAYSNTGYHLLGMIIHKVTGKLWGEFLRERVFDPLGMRTTEIHSASVSLTNLASGYHWREDKWVDGYFVAPTILGYAGGGMLSTVLDLAKWDAALYTGRLVKPSTLEQMWTAAKFNNGARSTYGFGWGVGDFRGRKFVTHSGAHMTGFRTSFLRFIEEKLTVVVLANVRSTDTDGIASGVAARVIPGLLLKTVKETADPDPELTQQLKDCLSDMADKKKSPLLTPECQTDFAKAPARATSLASRLKGMKAFTFLACEDLAGRKIERLDVPVSRVCSYKLAGEKETRYYTFYLTGEGKVAYVQSSME